ncbi:hypothetical protein S7711_09789 [Stachybotrys chartarum IBT 7711]|uniref:Uncharacterized protein n=1 Tax=Stachybotrys chartarum (strain CBS 109288 / IBT 7711) TaxID=1280523 RepID=A0A084ART1_STACB|nr:hypothetical protein S7711_09789 [Stachybotrys chartarum IBT 7711]KFA53921.1 hypothetical protein S40293_01797 [Stachybotrys chartarum IBT 40293]
MATQIQTRSQTQTKPSSAPPASVPIITRLPISFSQAHSNTSAWLSMDASYDVDAMQVDSQPHQHQQAAGGHTLKDSIPVVAAAPKGDDATSVAALLGVNGLEKSGEEACKRSLDHFPNPTLNFPMPTLEFDLRIAVKLKPEPSNVEGKCPKEITTISSGRWSGSFGTGHVVVRRSFGFYKLDLSQSERCADMHDQAGGYDLGQARGFRPIRIVEGAFVMQTMDDPPAALEMRTRGSLSGPSDILDTLLNPRKPKDIDPRQYGFRMFSTIKTADKRYADIVNCGLWVASGVWRDQELVIE